MDTFEKVHGCLLGVMIGDALGSPMEMMSSESILSSNFNEPITGFNHSIKRKHLPTKKAVTSPIVLSRWQDVKQRAVTFLGNKFSSWPKKENIDEEVPESSQEPDLTTDDWQLTNAVLTSLVRRGRFDATDMALSHITAYESSTSGWGGTTRDSIKELKQYFAGQGRMGRSPNDRPQYIAGKGSGNGVAMKVMPLMLMHYLKLPNNRSDTYHELLAKEVADLGRLTHSDPRAWAAAYAVACLALEMNTGDAKAPGIVLQNLMTQLASFERRYGSNGLKRFSSYLKVLLDDSLLLGPIEKLREEVGTGCIITESVVFAIALYLRNPFDFSKAVLEAVNSGGDTDTIASIVGALVGFTAGPKIIPWTWINHSTEFNKTEDAAKQLYNTFKV